MDQTVYILCGLIGSGKSTWAKIKRKEDSNTLIICKDAIRSMISGDYIFDKKYEDFVKSVNTYSILEALKEGFNVIVDETNITKKIRAYYINTIKNFNPDIKIELVYFSLSEGNVERRMNEHRGMPREIWQTVFETMLSVFEKPEENELPENGKLYII